MILRWVTFFEKSGSKILRIYNTFPKIFKANIDGSNITQLTTSFWSIEPCWARDGERIAYSNGDSANAIRTIWIMDKDGSNKKKVIDLIYKNAVSPAW